jgi:hypothetical protein
MKTAGIIEKLKPSLVEIAVFGLVILLLTVGTHWRNRLWNNEMDFWNQEKAICHLRVALMFDLFLPNRSEIQGMVRLIEEFS